MPKALDRELWKEAHAKALEELMDERVVTAPRKGGLSVYGTNVLMNISNNMGGLPTKNSQLTSFGEKGEKISGEYVNEHILVNDPTCNACPVACKKEVEIKEGPYKGLFALDLVIAILLIVYFPLSLIAGVSMFFNPAIGTFVLLAGITIKFSR